MPENIANDTSANGNLSRRVVAIPSPTWMELRCAWCLTITGSNEAQNQKKKRHLKRLTLRFLSTHTEALNPRHHDLHSRRPTTETPVKKSHERASAHEYGFQQYLYCLRGMLLTQVRQMFVPSCCHRVVSRELFFVRGTKG